MHKAAFPTAHDISRMTLEQRRKYRLDGLRSVRHEAKKLRSKGHTQSQIAYLLNEKGFRTLTGVLLDQPYISNLLSGTAENQAMGGS